MIRAMVVDDEQITANLIGQYLEATGRVVVEKIIYNSKEVIDQVKQVQPDVVFLDIEMPEISGLELSESITLSFDKTEVVFITAYSNYALEAFRANAIDYVMKPVDPRELERVLDKVIKKQPHHLNGNAVHVTTLGSLVTQIDGVHEPVKWRTAKCEELFAYMIFKKESPVISKWKLMEILWPDKQDLNCEVNLRSTVFRTNKTFKEYGMKGRVVSQNGHYRLEMENLKVDAFEMEKRIEAYITDDFKTMPTLKEFCELYTGFLFEDRYYSWAQWMQEYYLQIFINFGKTLIKIRNQRNHELDITHQMIGYMVELDPYNEELREMVMEQLYKLKGKKYVRAYYLEFEKLLQNQLGVSPQKQLKELYQRLTR